VRTLPTNDDAWTNAPSPVPQRLPHIPVPHLHTHPHGHGHYYHHAYNAAPLVGHTGGDRERRLRVRVRQIRDVLLTSASPVSASESGVTSVTTTATAAPTPSHRRSRMEAGAGAGTTDMDVDVDVDTDDGDEAEAEVETDCLTSRAPSRAASPPPRQRRLAVHSGALEAVGLGLEAEAMEVGGTVATPAHLDLAGTCFDPRGGWLYVASTAGIVEWGVRGGEKRWWAEAVWA